MKTQTIPDIVEGVMAYLDAQPWASRRYIHIEITSSTSSSGSTYIHVTDSKATITLRVSDHQMRGKRTHEVITTMADLEQVASVAEFLAAAKSMMPWSEKEHESVLEAKWLKNAKASARSFTVTELASAVYDYQEAQMEAEMEDGLEIKPLTLKQIRAGVDRADAAEYGAQYLMLGEGDSRDNRAWNGDLNVLTSNKREAYYLEYFRAQNIYVLPTMKEYLQEVLDTCNTCIAER